MILSRLKVLLKFHSNKYKSALAWRAERLITVLTSPTLSLRVLLDPIPIYVRYARAPRNKGAQLEKNNNSGLARCEVFFINLDSRTDRRKSFAEQIASVDLTTATRFSAIRNQNGAIGCSLSHLAILSTAKVQDGRLLMICEDDCEFLVDRKELDLLVEEFYENPKLDVLCLAFNTLNKRKQATISKSFLLTENTQTTACYVIKPHMIKPLAAVAKQSADELAANNLPGKSAIDVVWKNLQKTHFFVVPRRRAAKQITSYSDIEQADVSYGV